MSQNILTECAMFINHQIMLHERLLAHHEKVYLALDKLLAMGSKSYSASSVNLYVWEIRDIISQAKELNQSILRTLLSIVKFIEAARKLLNDNNVDIDTVH
jgi:hypothetical protein